MLIDLIVVVVLAIAVFKGFRRGLIVGIFSFVAIIVGLAAALKLSALVAGYLETSVNVSAAWLPVLSFLIVFIGVVLLVRLGANALQKAVELSLLGWVNRLGGIILYAGLFLAVLSVVFFYAEQLHFIRESTIQQSVTWGYIRPWGPATIRVVSAIIPWFRDAFEQLQHFFAGVADKAAR